MPQNLKIIYYVEPNAAALATAESNLVESLYAYNVSKIGLARASGVLEQQYRTYLGR